MRLLIFFLLLSGFCHGQQLLDKPVNINRQTGTVGSFLNDLDSLPGISLGYSSGVTDLSRVVRLTGREKTVADFLNSILKGQAVKYIEQGDKIFLVADGPVKKKFTIKGYISDKKSGERLIGASIYLPGKRIGTTSNAYGFFSITLEDETVALVASYTGFLTYATEINLDADTELKIELEPNVIEAQVIVVSSDNRKNQSRAAGKTDISSGLIKSVPALLGEADVLKTLQLLPGVQAGNEGTSGLNIRGGSADQNLILLDGVPVYNASHAFGVFSVFNPDAVFNVEILKSGFPASYGGRLSSVIDVHLKEGDKYAFHGEGGIGLIFSKLTLEGPLKKERSSFLVSARRTYADLLIRPLLKLSKSADDVFPFFSDINVKANFPVGEQDRFYISAYMGQDRLRSKTTYGFGYSFDTVTAVSVYDLTWGNITGMARWNHEFNKKTFSNFTFTHSRYKFRSEQSEERTSRQQPSSHSRQNYSSGIQDWSIRSDIDYLPAPAHSIKTGFAATLHRYQPGISHYFEEDTIVRINKNVNNNSMHAGEFDVYVEDDIRLSDKTKINTGIRFSAFAVKGKVFLAAQPRFNWWHQLNDRWSVKASFGRMNQFIHLLTNSSLALPTDLWLPVTKRVPPQASNQISGGLTYRARKSVEASVEVYYKSMKNVIDYTEGSGFGNAYDSWEDMVATGKGTTYGAEWLLQKKKGAVTGLLSYSLGRSLRQFDHINGGRSFPYKYDKRHEVKIAAVWQVSKYFECSADWLFSTGNAITLPEAYYYDPYTSRSIDVYISRNNYRLPNYHRMDVSIKAMKQKKKHLRTWVFSIYNVYNHFNPLFIYKTDYDKVQYRQVSVLPFLPSFSYQFKF